MEHYGYVTLKAKMCGLWTLTHYSGNTDLSDFTWRGIDELVTLTEGVAPITPPTPYVEGYAYPQLVYTKDNFLEELRRLL